MTRTLTVVLALATLVACDEAAPSLCTAVVDTAAAEALWGASRSCPSTIRIVSADRCPLGQGSCAPHDGLQLRERHHWIALDPALPDADLILAHEMGHLLGAAHSADRCDIMYPDASWDVGCIRASFAGD